MTRLLALVGTLCRFAIFMAKREALREKGHCRDADSRDCMCEPCQWARGIETEADEAALGKWR